jgi:NADP-dependent 3-hydroxy acid dehydrogenase YdfG
MVELCMDRLKNKVALITGGSRGLGASIAKHFFNEGAKIILCDIDIKKANEIANELNGKAYFMDVSNSKNVEDIFSNIKS